MLGLAHDAIEGLRTEIESAKVHETDVWRTLYAWFLLELVLFLLDGSLRGFNDIRFRATLLMDRRIFPLAFAHRSVRMTRSGSK